MNPLVNDVRVLKLAEMYESAFARLLSEMGTYVHDEDVRGKLARLLASTGHRIDRIKAEIARLGAKIGWPDGDDLERCAIQDVHETERVARAFYLRHVEEVGDPGVASLFRELAHEGRARVRVAEDALGLHDRRVLARHPGIHDAAQLRKFIEEFRSGNALLDETRLRQE